MIVAGGPRPDTGVQAGTGGHSRTDGSQVAGVVAAVASIGAGAVVVGRPGCGFDSSWALVWAADILHGRAPLAPGGVIVPTPHPASLLSAIAVRLGPTSAARPLWAFGVELALLALLSGVFVLAKRWAGLAAGCAAVVGAAAPPALGEAVGAGTVDVLFSAAVIWAVVCAARRPGWAMSCASVAALARPEGWLLLAILGARTWPTGRVRLRVGAFVAAVLAPMAWLVMGAAWFGGPLAAIHVTVGNAQTSHARLGVPAALHALVAGGGGIGILLAGVGLASIGLQRNREPSMRLAGSGVAAMTIAVLLIAAAGAATPGRYFAAELALAVPVGVATICALASHPRTRRAAGAAVMIVSIVAVARSAQPRSLRGHAEAEQRSEIAALGQVLATGQRCVTVLVAPTALLPVVVLETGHQVAVAASGAGPAGGCRLIAQNPMTVAGAGFGPEPPNLTLEQPPPGATVIGSNDDWALYAT